MLDMGLPYLSPPDLSLGLGGRVWLLWAIFPIARPCMERLAVSYQYQNKLRHVFDKVEL